MFGEEKTSFTSRLPRFFFKKKAPNKNIIMQKVDKDKANQVEKQVVVESSKIPVLRAKVRDSCDELKIVAQTHHHDKDPFRRVMSPPVAVPTSGRMSTSKSEYCWGSSAPPAAAVSVLPSNKHSNTSENIRPKSMMVNTDELLSNFLKDRANRPVVERGLVRERAQLFEKKIKENKVMVEARKRPVARQQPRYCEPTVASLNKMKPVVVPKKSNNNNNNNLPSSSSAYSWSRVTCTSSSSGSVASKPVLVRKSANKVMSTSGSSGKSSTSPLSADNKVCDYFDDEYIDQPDLTLNSMHETDSNYVGTPACEHPPTQMGVASSSEDASKAIMLGGGESDGRDLASELFEASQQRRQEKAKLSSLNASLESLEMDNQTSRDTKKSGNEQMTNWRKYPEKIIPGNVCHCGGGGGRDMLQDVLCIKTYLHKLKKALHEPEDLQVAQPENAKSVKITEDEVNDLKRQIVYLQQQNAEKDKTLALLQNQLEVRSPTRHSRGQHHQPISLGKTLTNAATQTDKVHSPPNRSLSSSPAGSLISSGEYRSNTAERCRLRRSRTPISCTRSPLMPPSHNVIKCSEDGTLRIAIRQQQQQLITHRPRTTSGYYNYKPFL